VDEEAIKAQEKAARRAKRASKKAEEQRVADEAEAKRKEQEQDRRLLALAAARTGRPIPAELAEAAGITKAGVAAVQDGAAKKVVRKSKSKSANDNGGDDDDMVVSVKTLPDPDAESLFDGVPANSELAAAKAAEENALQKAKRAKSKEHSRKSPRNPLLKLIAKWPQMAPLRRNRKPSHPRPKQSRSQLNQQRMELKTRRKRPRRSRKKSQRLCLHSH
jgi:hypothetical protein